jgi:hypothetical protein
MIISDLSSVVRVLGYRSRGPGSIPSTRKKILGLERGPLSLVNTTEELLDSSLADSDHGVFFISDLYLKKELNLPKFHFKFSIFCALSW